MLDVLLLPAAFLLALALWSVRRGEHRLHGYLMTAAFTTIGLRVLLHPRDLNPVHLTAWLLTLGAAGLTILLGRRSLAWRESRSTTASGWLHRACGLATLSVLSLTTLVWLLRNRGVS
jgi:hypothetical protein